MKSPLWPIRTGQVRAPWLWVGLLSGPWAAMFYFEMISQQALTFKIREFVSTPALITLIASFNLVFNIFVGATCNFASDRVWTPIGRRKPFLLLGWGMIAIGCLLLPEINTLGLLVVVLFFYEMLRDTAIPYESLVNEVVPPKQRGRCMATLTVARELMKALFFAVLLGRWDETFAISGLCSFSGEHLIFWTASALAIGAMAFVGFGIRETKPDVMQQSQPAMDLRGLLATGRGFLREVFGTRQWLAVYAVALAQMIFWTGFGSLTPLLFTEQWSFSKQEYGNVVAIGTAFTVIVCLPVGGWLADRVDRIFMFKLLAGLVTLVHLVFFIYLKIRAGNHIPPPLAAVLTHWLLQWGLGNLGVVCTVSMMFDFVPRNRLGTVASGIGITRGVANIFINNGIGLWVTGFSWVGAAAVGGTVAYDYESGFLYLVLLGLAATGVAFWFSSQVTNGRIRKLGVLEAEQDAAKQAPLDL